MGLSSKTHAQRTQLNVEFLPCAKSDAMHDYMLLSNAWQPKCQRPKSFVVAVLCFLGRRL